MAARSGHVCVQKNVRFAMVSAAALQDECLVINLMFNEDETTIFLLYTRQCQNESEHTRKNAPHPNHFCALAKNHLQTKRENGKMHSGGMEAKK